MPDDPLVGVAGFNAKEDRRHDRRTLGVDDLRRLIEAAERGAPYRRMSGPARALCYRLAVATGLRYSEIKSLTPESFDGGSVTIHAAYAKDGQTATLPVSPDVADDLAAWVADKPEQEPAFPAGGRICSALTWKTVPWAGGPCGSQAHRRPERLRWEAAR